MPIRQDVTRRLAASNVAPRMRSVTTSRACTRRSLAVWHQWIYYSRPSWIAHHRERRMLSNPCWGEGEGKLHSPVSPNQEDIVISHGIIIQLRFARCTE